ncbi:MAG: zf-HC2 domain-containing protein, partial [Labilithrix sp.]|nr:zf-HC2 domain-containing protein [Labilithrix sp.]
MDCEKFEPLLLDELYEELDELTSAAVKRHVSGCARCAAILGDMTSTRRAVSLPLVPAPADLEDRILAAVKEAQKVVPIRSRLSRALSVAGSWAMRPQTAMAAVFLLMIGTSAFLVRSKNHGSRDAAVSVTVAGAPAPTEAAAESDSLDDKAAAAAHGPTPPNVTRPPAAAASAFAFAEPPPA